MSSLCRKDSGVYSLGSDSTGKELAYSATLDRLQQSTVSLTAATSNRILKEALYQITRKGDPELISGLAGSSMAWVFSWYQQLACPHPKPSPATGDA